MDLITTVQAAAELGVTRRRVQAMIKAGRLKAKRLGRDYFVTAADLAAVRERPPGRPRKLPEKPKNLSA